MPDNVLPLDTLKQIIAQYNATGAQAKRTPGTQLHRRLIRTEVADALRRIPPWGIDYDEWVRCHGTTCGLATRRLAAESWADGADGEVRRKWRAFANGNAGHVGVGTVYAIAKLFWMAAAVATGGELMTEQRTLKFADTNLAKIFASRCPRTHDSAQGPVSIFQSIGYACVGYLPSHDERRTHRI